MMIDVNRGRSIRVNLHVHVTTMDGVPAYHTLHIGFFPHRIAAEAADSLNIRGIAFHSDIERQAGRVSAVLAWMRDGLQQGDEITTRTEAYEPPGKWDAA